MYRKRTSLSQREIAFLVGLNGGQDVSRYERLARSPSLRMLLAAHVLYGVSPHELYPGLFKEVEQLIIKRAKMLDAELSTKRHTPVHQHKREFLVEVIQNIEARNRRV